jgi:hypothetical protein
MNWIAVSFGAILPPLALLVTLLLGACGGETGKSAWTIATDTTDGVLRVVITPPESGPVPTLVAQDELRVGMVEGGGPESFGMIRAIAVLPDGRFAVADGQAEEVRLFGPDGKHLRTFGGKGAGPGELHGMQGVHVDHEGLLRVAEQANARLSVFHPDSGYVTSYPLATFGRASQNGSRVRPVWMHREFPTRSRHCTACRWTTAAGSGCASLCRPQTPPCTTFSTVTAATPRPCGCRSASTATSRPSCAVTPCGR